MLPGTGQVGAPEVLGTADTNGKRWGGNQGPERPQSRNEERDVVWFLLLSNPVGLCAFLGGGCSRFWVGSEVVRGLRKLLYWPEAQVHSDGGSAGGWPELCQGPLPSHGLWPVARSQDSAASTAPHISSPL